MRLRLRVWAAVPWEAWLCGAGRVGLARVERKKVHSIAAPHSTASEKCLFDFVMLLCDDSASDCSDKHALNAVLYGSHCEAE